MTSALLLGSRSGGGAGSASLTSVNPSGLAIVTTNNVQAALAELDAAVDANPELASSDVSRVSLSTPPGSGVTTMNVDALALDADLNSTNGYVTLLLGQVPQRIVLEADSAPASDATTWIDSGLQVNLAVANYLLSGWVPWLAGTAPDIEFQWAGTATVGGFYTMFGPGTAGAGSESTIKNLTVGMAVASSLGGGGTGRCSGLPSGRVTCTAAGTLKLQFRQNTADASPINIETGAWLEFQPDGT